VTDSVITNRGRVLEIAGTLMTVYEIVDYLDEGLHPTAIATLFRSSSREVISDLRFSHSQYSKRGLPGAGLFILRPLCWLPIEPSVAP
jgi:hypothetical protein